MPKPRWCSRCATLVRDQEAPCPKCGAPAGLSIKAYVGLGLLAIIGVASLAMYVIPKNAGAPRGSDCINPGEICRISASAEWIPAATSMEAWDELERAMQADDRQGLIEIANSGRALAIRPGDDVRILDVSVWSGWAECRLVTGQHAGRKVWVSRSLVKAR